MKRSTMYLQNLKVLKEAADPTNEKLQINKQGLHIKLLHTISKLLLFW